MLLHIKVQASVLCLEATLYKCTFSEYSKASFSNDLIVLIPDHYYRPLYRDR